MKELILLVIVMALPVALYGFAMLALGAHAPAVVGLPVAAVSALAIPPLIYLGWVWRMS